MAVGDDALAAGYTLVPDTGIDGEVRFGAREINRTRDYIAQLKALVLGVLPVSRGGTGGNDTVTAKNGLGIYSGTAAASDAVGGTVDGNIYFRIVG